MANTLKPLITEDGELNLSTAQIKQRYGIKMDAHIAFAMEYLADPRRNGARAYAKVYNGSTKPRKSDTVNSHLLLKDGTPLRQFIDDFDTGAAKLMTRRGIISKEQVLSELIKLGFCDIGDLYDEDNNLRPIADLASDVSPAVRKIKEKVIKRSTDEATGEETVVLSREIEMHDKKGALQLLGQHLQMFVQKNELEVTTSVDQLIKDITHRNAANRNGLLPKNNCRLPPLESETNDTH
mgnify:FL=1